ncbi:MAG: SDR family NAD(P)-dependent oxidoreductase [Gammaproteobacteria bacterium]|nr:SDR family NAD(P)-dependent oxidoreductase [Gammaproteobacteria bacterium]
MKASRVAVVSGASSGIGAATARALAAAGVRVFLIGRSAARLERTARRIGPRRVLGRQVCRLESVPELRRLARGIASRTRRVDILVHCAGQHAFTGRGAADAQAFDELFAVNVRAPYLLTAALLPQLARARGLVVFVNSSVVRNSGEGVALYKASKQALQGFADSVRQDLNRRGVRAVSLYPGRTATPSMRRIYAHEGRPYRPRWLLRPQDLADLVRSLSELPAGMEVTDVFVRSAVPY